MDTHPTINPDRLARRVISIAMQFNGLREIKPNREFDDPRTAGLDAELNRKLLAMYGGVGWEPGWAHCAAFVDGCYCAALQQEGADQFQIKQFTKLMQLGVMNSVDAFRARGMLSRISAGPGSIWFARHGMTRNGHTGIVITAEQRMLNTIEANTSKDSTDKSKDREGDWITTRLFSINGRGDLRTQGFVGVQEICQFISQ